MYHMILEKNQTDVKDFKPSFSHKQLEAELEKIYPGTKIDRSYDDVVINKAYTNYQVMVDGFDQMKKQLHEVNPLMAKQCIKKELHTIKGTDKKAIRSRIESRERATMMIPIVINIDRREYTGCIIGDNNHHMGN